jgi:hypothetical protein
LFPAVSFSTGFFSTGFIAGLIAGGTFGRPIAPRFGLAATPSWAVILHDRPCKNNEVALDNPEERPRRPDGGIGL